jgi:iron complex outermembrane receptor protein
VSHTYEAGLRGGFKLGPRAGAVTWSVAAYRTDVDDDILLLASNINGFGYFQNAGSTRREGLDLHVGYADDRLSLSAGYSHIDATFLNGLDLSSNSPAADASGVIHIRPGDRLPLIPADRLTLSADYAVTGGLNLGGDLRVQGPQYLAGDASNQEAPLPGFSVLDLRASYRLGPRLEVFGEVRNLLDRRYYSYGTFANLDGLPRALGLSNPRSLSPGEGRSIAVGARFQLF